MMGRVAVMLEFNNDNGIEQSKAGSGESPIVVFLVGEDHIIDQNIRSQLENYCRQTNTILAIEQSRMKIKYDFNTNEIGDFICNLHSCIANLFLSMSLREELTDYWDEFEIKNLNTIYHNLACNNETLIKAKLFYEKKYKCEDLFKKIYDEIKNLQKSHIDFYISFMNFLNELITSSNQFNTENIFGLNVSNFKMVNEINEREFRSIINCELREQAFVHNIRDLILFARKRQVGEIVIVLGQAHIDKVGKTLLEQLSSVLVIKNNFYQEFIKNWNAYITYRSFLTQSNNVQTTNFTHSSNSFFTNFNKQKFRKCLEYEDVIEQTNEYQKRIKSFLL